MRQIVVEVVQTCSTCKRALPLEMYHKGKSPFGLQYQCKDCYRTYQRANRPRFNAASARYKGRHPDRLVDQQLRYLYGISLKEYDEMLQKQKGVCAICKGTCERARLSVDHDKETGAVRGLLCNSCNVSLGRMAHDPDRLEAAARYLRESL